MTEQTAQRPEPQKYEEGEISLIDLAIALGEEKLTLFIVPALTTTMAVVVSLLMTPIFTAKTVMMPPQQQQSGAASALASLGALAGLGGGLLASRAQTRCMSHSCRARDYKTP